MDFRYFGLNKSPFEQTSGVQPFYINDSYREAFVALRYGIELRLGLVVLTGDSGVGKTSLVTLFRDSAKKNVRLMVLSARSYRPAGLLLRIAAGLGLELSTEHRAATQTLKRYLLEQFRAGQIVAIIIDDADELTREDFAELKRLLSLRSDTEHLVQIVLAGSPALPLLNDPALKSLRQRIRVWAKIPSLTSQEVAPYIEHKLSFAGSLLRGLFRAGAAARIAAYSQGIPKTIDALCDRSLRLAYLKRQETITEWIVEAAWKGVHGSSEPDIEASLYSGDLHSRSSAETYVEAPNTPGAKIMGNGSNREAQWPDAGRAMEPTPTRQSWISLLSQRVVLSLPIRQHGRQLLSRRSYQMVGAILSLTLAAAVLARPGSDRPTQPDLVQEAKAIVESQPEPLTLVPEESAVQTEPIETNASTPGDTVVPAADPSPQLEKRTESGRGELVYLHTSQAGDFRALEDIGAVLRSEGYVVRDTRFTGNSTKGDVRFFFADDRGAAERVKSVVEAELQTRGYPRRLQLLERDGKKFRFAAPGKIEVWLPPLIRSDKG